MNKRDEVNEIVKTRIVQIEAEQEETRQMKDDADKLLELEIRAEKQRETAQEVKAEIECELCGKHEGDCVCWED